MSNLAETLRRLAEMGRPDGVGHGGEHDQSGLIPLGDFGTNPGGLDALYYLPPDILPAMPLVVVLHGCTQTAQAYERGAGWTILARDHGFAVLYPQQKRSNNGNLCFNWFDAQDVARQGGEAESIAQMVSHLASRHCIDPGRIHITGLSAGGAMTSAMLVRYPEMFAAGAIIAGLPFDVAHSVSQAMDRMRGRGLPPPDELATRVRAATAHSGPWPRLSIWHGTADHVVAVANARAIVDQWLPLHGLANVRPVESTLDGHQHLSWNDRDGQTMIEHHSLAGFGHATPIDSLTPDALGKPGPHMLEAGTSSTRRIAQFWGIVPEAERSSVRASSNPVHPGQRLSFDVHTVIDAALRRAGIKP